MFYKKHVLPEEDAVFYQPEVFFPAGDAKALKSAKRIVATALCRRGERKDYRMEELHAIFLPQSHYGDRVPWL